MPQVDGIAKIVGWRNCPHCGKLFFVTTSEWCYKEVIQKDSQYKGTFYYCSWSCFRKGSYRYRKERIK